MNEFFIEAQNISKTFDVRRGVFGRARQLHAVSDVSFGVRTNATFGLVGESGSGKTTLAKILMGAESPTSGVLKIDGQVMENLSRSQRRAFPLLVQPVLQDPYSALNPRMRVGQIIDEPTRINRLASTAAQRAARVDELVRLVGLTPDFPMRFPHELSGGQRQRVAIARALSVNPRCIVLDEPVSALDVSIQAQILNLLKDLQDQLGFTYVLISHDLAVVSFMSDQIGVLYLGQFMEIGDRSDIIEGARHPYTKVLLSAASHGAPIRDMAPGEIPSPLAPPPGCPFQPRCNFARALCREENPRLRRMSASHLVACHFAEEVEGQPTNVSDSGHFVQ